MIKTDVTDGALLQAQRRGITRKTLTLILRHADRSQKLPGRIRALWISRKGRDRLVWNGFAPADVARASGVRLIIDIHDDVVKGVDHMTARRAWA